MLLPREAGAARAASSADSRVFLAFRSVGRPIYGSSPATFGTRDRGTDGKLCAECVPRAPGAVAGAMAMPACVRAATRRVLSAPMHWPSNSPLVRSTPPRERTARHNAQAIACETPSAPARPFKVFLDFCKHQSVVQKGHSGLLRRACPTSCITQPAHNHISSSHTLCT